MDIQDLANQVKHNSNISDAKYWGFYSPCGFLLSMRELYFQEKGVPPWESGQNQKIISWIAEREIFWELLAEQDYNNLIIDGKEVDPFDVKMVNSSILEKGLLYDGGIGLLKKPVFSLATLANHQQEGQFQIFISEEFICRGLSAPIALSLDNRIIINRELLSRFLHYKMQDWQSKRFPSIADDLFESLGIGKKEKSSQELFDKLMQVLGRAENLIIHHEMGEIIEDENSHDWREIVFNTRDKITELNLRAFHDILADTSKVGSLHYIIHNQDLNSMALYLTIMDDFRKKMFPEIIEAYINLKENGDWKAVKKVTDFGYKKFSKLKNELIKAWKSKKNIKAVEKIVLNKGVS